jgi:hypothetical protein
MLPRFVALWSLLSFVGVGSLYAQAPGVPIESADTLSDQARVIRDGLALKEAGSLLSAKQVAELMKKPAGGIVELEEPKTVELTPRQVLDVARKSFLRVGWLYLCPHCDKWHVNLAGAYVIDRKGAVATCDHCLEPDEEMREGYLIAVDDEEKVYAVETILATNAKLDAAIIRIKGSELPPLPLQDQVAPGDAAYLYSEPFGNQGYFSAGMVNRFYWKAGESGDPTKFKDVVRLRVNVSTDWAPGSSGAAVLDSRGNAIGHVSEIETLGDGEDDEHDHAAATMITLHEAVPARGVLLLAKSLSKPGE